MTQSRVTESPFLRTVVLVVGTFGTVTAAANDDGGHATAAAAVRSPREKPNIVMLFVDDLGYGDVGFTGHPTTHTPNIDALAHGGKILSSWYSGCPVCSGSRAALMTGRQFNRVGVPGVFGSASLTGLPLNETTVADQLKRAGYATAMVGKWHLGQRPMFLPGARGFDSYLGIPYSDDMGEARRSPCPGDDTRPCQQQRVHHQVMASDYRYTLDDDVHGTAENLADLNRASKPLLPLVYQSGGVVSGPGAGRYAKNTTVLEQPLDFTTLATKYNKFAIDFIKASAANPFFLYVPFSHVHTTWHEQPQSQYAGCAFQNTTARGAFGDALAEVDWMIGNIVHELDTAGILENSLVLFTGDNGPWLTQGLSSGSAGIHHGRYAGYWNTGKGSTWDGGIHMAAFAYWKGQITPGTRSLEVVSSLDLFPTASALAGVALPSDRVYDGRSMIDVLLKDDGKSMHEVLFFYGGATGGHDMLVSWDHEDPSKPGFVTKHMGPSAARMGCWKAHWGTGHGLGACTLGAGEHGACPAVQYPLDAPLLFNICIDPSEGIPLAGANNGTHAGQLVDWLKPGKKEPSLTMCGQKPWCKTGDKGCYAPCPPFNASLPGPSPVPVSEAEITSALAKIVAAVKIEMATFTYGRLVAPKLLPGEQNNAVGVCCDKDPFKPMPTNYSCDCNGRPYGGSNNAYPHVQECGAP